MTNPQAAQPAQAPPSIMYVSFVAEITRQTSENLMDTMSKIANAGVPEVYLMLNTTGGDVSHGVGLYNFLKALPVKLVTHNIGTVASIGNAVFLAGAERYASPQATFMFHGVYFQFGGGKMDDKYLREQLGAIDAEHERIGAVMAERTSLAKEVIEGMFQEQQTRGSQFAKETGIVHDVRDLSIPAGVRIHTIVNPR